LQKEWHTVQQVQEFGIILRNIKDCLEARRDLAADEPLDCSTWSAHRTLVATPLAALAILVHARGMCVAVSNKQAGRHTRFEERGKQVDDFC
jgi:hypothetical protein